MDIGFFGTWGVLFYTNLVAVLVEKFFCPVCVGYFWVFCPCLPRIMEGYTMKDVQY